MDRLKEGNAVPINFQATIAVGARQNVVRRVFERFVISYDLWEESFKVVRLGERKSASNLTAAQTEAWCYDNLPIPLADIRAISRCFSSSRFVPRIPPCACRYSAQRITLIWRRL